MKKVMRRMFLMVLVGVAPSSPALAVNEIEQGLWEITSTMEMPGMPEIARRPMTFTHCYTKRDVENPQNVAKDKNENCRMSNYKLAGNKATWEVQCTGEHPMTGKGEMTFSRNNYKGVSKFSSKGMEMTQHISARRLGECTGGQDGIVQPPSPAVMPAKTAKRSRKEEPATKAESPENPAKDETGAEPSDAVLDSAKKLKGLLGF